MTADEKDLVGKILDSIKEKRPDLIPEDWSGDQADPQIYQAVGCAECHQSGYNGREGIFEAILMDDAVAQATIVNPNEKEIKLAAKPQKILDMRQDGILKVIKGETTIEEVGRVIDLAEEII